MEIIVGSDHGGFGLKEKIKKWLVREKHAVEDVGCHSGEKCDYPDYAEKIAEKVLEKKESIGIAVCGTGIGISIAANKINGIRAALIHNAFTARMAREHNNANIICLGGRTTNFESAKAWVEAFMDAQFAGGRHENRIGKIAALEKK